MDKFPVIKKSVLNGVVVRFTSAKSGEVLEGDEGDIGHHSDGWVDCTDTQQWEDYEMPTPDKAPLLEMTLVELADDWIAAQVVSESKEWVDYTQKNCHRETRNLEIYINQISLGYKSSMLPTISDQATLEQCVEWITEIVKDLEIRPDKPKSDFYHEGFEIITDSEAVVKTRTCIATTYNGYAYVWDEDNRVMQSYSSTLWQMPATKYKVVTEERGVVTTLRVVEV